MRIGFVKRALMICTTLLALSLSAHAQKKVKNDTYVPQVALTWNAADLVETGQISVGTTIPLAKHLSFNLDLKCYPWTTNDFGKTEFQNLNTVVQPGIRYWFWHVNSGFWMNTAFKWKAKRFRQVGVEEWTNQNIYGLVETVGYSLMLGKHMNLNFGIGGGIGMNQEPRSIYSWREFGLGDDGKLFLEYAEPVVGISIVF